jgi:hypothetical protein
MHAEKERDKDALNVPQNERENNNNNNNKTAKKVKQTEGEHTVRLCLSRGVVLPHPQHQNLYKTIGTAKAK